MSDSARWRRRFLILATMLLTALAVVVVYGKQIRAAKVDAAAIVVQAQRLSAADTLYQRDHDGAHASDITALVVDAYLSAPPQLSADVAGAMELDPATGLIHCTVASVRICAAINGELSADNPVPVAANTTVAALDEAIEMPYGCAAVGHKAGQRTYHFIFH